MRYFIIGLIIVLQGCSSLSSHLEQEFGHPYSGTESAVSSVGCNLAVSGTALFIPVPFIIVDIPLSVVLDTVFLPADLIVSADMKRQDVIFTEQKCLDGMSGKPRKPKENEESYAE